MLWGKRPDMIVREGDPFNAESPRSALAQGSLTQIETFYVRSHGPVPDVDPAAWRLTVDGLVEQPTTFTLAELRDQFSEHDVVATLQCAGNRRAGLMAVRDIPGEIPWGPGATSTARWTGARLCDVLAAAGADPQADHVVFEAPDVSRTASPPQSFGSSIPLAKARREEVLLAWAMNGVPLPAVHGGPVRVVVPGYIGARSVKWVNRISVRHEPSDNYYQALDYRLLPADADLDRARPGEGLSLGQLGLNSAILSPDDGATVPPGPTTVTGYALAGDDRGVARVDVSCDAGSSWRQARLEAQLSPWSWRLWSTEVHLSPGHHQITARAWDTAAALQPEREAHLWNPRGYVNYAWAVVHLTVAG